jgi:hypothetical protein
VPTQDLRAALGLAEPVSTEWLTFAEALDRIDPTRKQRIGDQDDWSAEQSLTDALAAESLSAWGRRRDGGYERIEAPYWGENAASAFEIDLPHRAYVAFRVERRGFEKVWAPKPEAHAPRSEMEGKVRPLLEQIEREKPGLTQRQCGVR